MKDLSISEMIEKYKKELIEFSRNNQNNIISKEVFNEEDDDIQEDRINDTIEVSDLSEVDAQPVISPSIVQMTDRVSVNDQAINRRVNENEFDDDITSLEGTNVTGYNAGRTEKQYNTYDEFVADNPETGTLIVRAFVANETFPANGADIEIKKELTSGDYVIHTGKTDESGTYGPVKLNAPSKEYSEEFSDREPYATYTLTVRKDGFITMIYKNLPIFPSVESDQTVNLVPVSQSGGNVDSIVINTAEPTDL